MPNAIDLLLGDRFVSGSGVQSSNAVWRFDTRFRVKGLDKSCYPVNYTTDKFLTHVRVRSTASFFGRDEVQLRINNTNYDFNAPNYSKTFDDGDFHNVTFTCDGTTLTCYRDGLQLSTTRACTSIFTLFNTIGYSEVQANNDFIDVESVALYNSIDTSVPVLI